MALGGLAVRGSQRSVLRERDTLWHRVRLVVICVLDACSCVALFFQLTPPGLPTLDVIMQRLMDPAIMATFWFWPFSAAAAGALVFGGIFGALLQVQGALWLYAFSSLFLGGCGLAIIFEQAKDGDPNGNQRPLLIDMLVTSACVLISLSAFSESVHLAIRLATNSFVRRCERTATRRGEFVVADEFADAEPRRSSRSATATSEAASTAGGSSGGSRRSSRRRARTDVSASNASTTATPTAVGVQLGTPAHEHDAVVSDGVPV